MTRILNIGMNHQSASVELRECLATDPGSVARALTFLREVPEAKEGLFLSTCNRVEALLTTVEPEAAQAAVVGFMAELGGVPVPALRQSLYVYQDREAVSHVFRVASSLDSMVVGEPQILGQIKDAYAEATRQKTAGVILNRLMHRAFHVAKRVRTETAISDAAVSISYAAVELAKKIFHVLEGKQVLLIGAGEMAELAARHLLGQGTRALVVANRTFERAVELAEEFKGRPVSFEEIGSELIQADIVITSTAATGCVITRDLVKGSLKKRRNRPLFLIDIAVPRDVEPEVNSLDNVYVYDIDDLRGVVEINLAQRKGEAVRAERIVQEEVVKFERWLETLAVVPTIVALQEKAEAILANELKKSASALAGLSQAEQQAVKTLTRSVAEKVLNDPIVYLKHKSGSPTLNTYLDAARKLFGLDPGQGADEHPEDH